MSEKEINAYRLTSLEEPTDEMLAYIMHEAAEEASQRYDEAMYLLSNSFVFDFLMGG